jgi:hypothetical protein
MSKYLVLKYLVAEVKLPVGRSRMLSSIVK